MSEGQSWFGLFLSWLAETFHWNVDNVMKWFSAETVGLHVEGHDEHAAAYHSFTGSPLGIEQLQHVVGALFVLVVLLLLGLNVRNRLSDPEAALVPEERFTVRTFFELVVGAVYNQMTEMMGARAARFFLPLIGTCAILIFVSNALGLIPGFLPPTEKINVTVAAAIVIFCATHFFGVKEHGVSYFKHFFGPILKWYALPLMLLMFVIEFISHVVRPVTLAVRLAANMTADHIVLTIFIGLVPFLVPLPMYIMGCVVVTVQALVFTLLSMIYISLAIAHEEH